MQLNRTLIRWYFQTVRTPTLVAAAVASGFALFYTGRLAEITIPPLLFIMAQSVFTTRQMTRFDTPSAAFLYTRGFSRDRLWSHRIAAHLLCALAVWGPASLLVWLGVRSVIQDQLVENPYYPLMKSADYGVPLVWLATYLLLVGAVEYGPVRRAQPTRDRDAGYIIECGLMFLLIVTFAGLSESPRLSIPIAVVVAFASIVLLVGGWRLHRRIEIQP